MMLDSNDGNIKLVSILIGIFISIIAIGTKAQSGEHVVVENFNHPLLQTLIISKIDSIRNMNKRQVLHTDSILFKAAKWHVDYLCTKGDLTHTETGKRGLANPQQRAEYFGATNYAAGENIAYTLVHQPVRANYGEVHTNHTYEQLAMDIVLMWKHSNPHYSNLLINDYSLTAVATTLDTLTYRVYVVQMFVQIRP